MRRSTLMMFCLTLCSMLSLGSIASAQAQEEGSAAMENCLKAWGTHPFGTNPKYRTLAVSVTVLGIGIPTFARVATGAP